jgi:DNA-3-methyladenine glycosylase
MTAARLHSDFPPPGKSKLLPPSFYADPPETVAPVLLGKLLVRIYKGERLIGRITEVEAYLGFDDPAAHASVGRTARNSVLFGPPGYAYVYFIYGMHYCLNVSCLPDGEPGGILFRAIYPVAGIETMAKFRGLSPASSPKLLTGGPGKICDALAITRAEHNGVDMTSPHSPLQILDDGFEPTNIRATPRIGIRKATDRLLRFLIA